MSKDTDILYTPTTKNWVLINDHIIDLNTIIDIAKNTYKGDYFIYSIYFYFINKESEKINFSDEYERDEMFNKLLKLLNVTIL